MKRAIDNYLTGMQREIDAIELRGISISSSQERFMCSDCGEFVALVNPTHKLPFFRHTNKTINSPQCEKRVDISANISIYERTGLPLYIRRTRENQFDLLIGFSALGISELKTAKINGVGIEIDASRENCGHIGNIKFLVNETSFYTDQTTLKPLNFVPSNEKDYSINYTGRGKMEGIRSKWSDYADGFTAFGAIFAYGEKGGRKVKKGDSITTNTKYFLATKHRAFPELKGLSIKWIGNLPLTYEAYDIYEIEFITEGLTEREFKLASSFCINNLRVTLLYKKSELIPIWPPCIHSDKSYETTTDAKEVFLKVKSGNDYPCAFEHIGKEVNEINLNKSEAGCNYFVIDASNYKLALSVDRKYSGNIITISCNKHCSGEERLKLIALDSNKIEYNIGTHLQLPVLRELNIIANFKATIYHKVKGYRFVKYKGQEAGIQITNLSKEDELIIYSPSAEVGRIVFLTDKKRAAECHNADSIYEKLIRSQLPLVQTPPWLRNKVREIGKTDACQKLLKKYVEDDEIPIGALRELLKFYKGRN